MNIMCTHLYIYICTYAYIYICTQMYVRTLEGAMTPVYVGLLICQTRPPGRAFPGRKAGSRRNPQSEPLTTLLHFISAYTYIYICMYAHINTYIYAYVYIYMCVCTHTYTYTLYTSACIYKHVYTYTHVCMPYCTRMLVWLQEHCCVEALFSV